MASSNWNLNLRCCLRGIKLKNRPEELLRQRVVQELLGLGYPRSWLAIEVPLQAMAANCPNRRLDLVAYIENPSKEQGGLIPLLLIECKAGPLTSEGWRQLLGYQYHIKAPFIAMINTTTCYFHALDVAEQDIERRPVQLERLPAFSDLTALLRPL